MHTNKERVADPTRIAVGDQFWSQLWNPFGSPLFSQTNYRVWSRVSSRINGQFGDLRSQVIAQAREDIDANGQRSN